MAATFTDKDRELLNRANLAHLATLGPDGSPQVSPVWVDLQGDVLRVNSSRGRAKVRNMERDPRVAISIVDRDDDYYRLLVRGRVVEVSTDGAVDHIHELARKYEGTDGFEGLTPDMVRMIFKISPEHLTR